MFLRVISVLTLFVFSSVSLGDVSFDLTVPDVACPVGGECVVWGTVTYTGDEPIQIVPLEETDTQQGLWSAPAGGAGCASSDFDCTGLLHDHPELFEAEFNGLVIEPGFSAELPVCGISVDSGAAAGASTVVSASFGVEGYWETENGFQVYEWRGSGTVDFDATALEPDFRTTVEAEMTGPELLDLEFSIEAPEPATWIVWLWPFPLWQIPIPATEPISFQVELPFPAGTGTWVCVTALATDQGIEAFDFSLFES